MDGFDYYPMITKSSDSYSKYPLDLITLYFPLLSLSHLILHPSKFNSLFSSKPITWSSKHHVKSPSISQKPLHSNGSKLLIVFPVHFYLGYSSHHYTMITRGVDSPFPHCFFLLLLSLLFSHLSPPTQNQNKTRLFFYYFVHNTI